MTTIKKTLKSVEQLQLHVNSGLKTFYLASQTSTVIPFDKLDTMLEGTCLGDLSQMSSAMEIDDNGNLILKGAVTWKDARAFCRSKGRDVMTAPTEELACILSGFATSATGERCFGFGSLREQANWIKYVDQSGEVVTLSADKELKNHEIFSTEDGQTFLKKYQESYSKYNNFKNAPFPRMLKETDLMTGTEGQLGIVVEASLKTTELKNVSYIFMKLPRWEEDLTIHMEIFDKVQGFRDSIYACEMIDENALSVIAIDDRIVEKGDLIFLEIDVNSFEKVYEGLLSELSGIKEEEIFEVSAAKCQALRMSIPRETFERNSRMGVTKKGTDVQTKKEDFVKLLELYREFTKLGVAYNLFGHFGDAHLHFNFMPSKDQELICQEKLIELYENIREWQGSPFAEHGIGLIKQKFIGPYWQSAQLDLFKYLKSKMDSENIFFPQGYMNLEEA